MKNNKGFTLIELLIVVAIIGILAAIAIPGYIGLQERSRRAAATRSVQAATVELQAWINSARKVGIESLYAEVDTNGDGLVTSGDMINRDLAIALSSAPDGLCSLYVSSRIAFNNEDSPWTSGVPLWIAGPITPGRISCNHGAGSFRITLTAQDDEAGWLYQQVIISD